MRDEKIHGFVTFPLNEGEFSLFHAPTILLPVELVPVPTRQETESDPKPAWTQFFFSSSLLPHLGACSRFWSIGLSFLSFFCGVGLTPPLGPFFRSPRFRFGRTVEVQLPQAKMIRNLVTISTFH
jgi:hypothetical protein